MSVSRPVSLLVLSMLLSLSCRHSPQDADISSAITSRFIEEQSVNLQRVDVYVEEGTAYLSGEVENREEHIQAGRIASRIPGVRRVINKLQVIP